jgi:23S rRNA pseudouridine955/2504/2580 synthase
MLVLGYWPAAKTVVDLPLLKGQIQSGERIVTVSAEGKSSLTYFKPLHHYSCATLLEARPATGRTHQLRVHAAQSGHPIACDEKYGDKAFNRLIHKLGCKRLFLHASSIQFTLGDEKKIISAYAPLPVDLQKLLTIID